MANVFAFIYPGQKTPENNYYFNFLSSFTKRNQIERKKQEGFELFQK